MSEYITVDLTPIKYKSYSYFTQEMADRRKECRDTYIQMLRDSHITGDSTEDEADVFLNSKEWRVWGDEVHDIDLTARDTYIDDLAGDKERILTDATDMLLQVTTDFFIADASFIMQSPAIKELLKPRAGKKAFTDCLRERFILIAFNSICYEQTEAAEKYDIDIDAHLTVLASKRFDALLDKVGGITELKAIVKDYDLDQFEAMYFVTNYCSDMDDLFGIMLTGEPPKTTLQKHSTPAAKRKNFLNPITLPNVFHTPNSFIANEFPFWQKNFYRDNDGQMTFILDAKPIDMDITNGRGDNPVNVYVALNYEGDITEDGTTTISYNKARIAGFDLAVLDAICSFMEHGTDNIYVSAIDNFLKGGKTQNNKVSKTRQDRIILALRKLSGTRIYLDVRNDLNTKYGDMFAKGIYDGAMLEYEGLQATTYAGRETYVFHVKDLPPIYKYSKAKGNIVQFPTVLLDTGDRADEDVIPLKKELLKHITLINKRIYKNPNISITSLYKRADVPEPTGANRKQKSRHIDRFREWLTYWKQYDYIKDFTIQGDTIHITPKYIAKDKNQSME